MIAADGASLIYMDHGREIFACRTIDLQVKDGEFLGILGPSGSGKSSLLYLLSGLKVPTRGTVAYNGQTFSKKSDKDLANLRLSDFGFVFQHPFLIGYVSALENVILARPDRPDPEEAQRLLILVGLESKLERLPHELSGGERQRVCVARALMGRPKVLFGDEPTAALDHASGVRVMTLLREHRGDGTLIVVTHDPTMLDGADRVVHMAEGCLVDSTD